MTAAPPTPPRMRSITTKLTGVAVALTVSLGAVACGGGDGTATGGAASAGPTFSQPSEITNPWLPISKTRRVELRGTEGKTQIRAVKTLLDRTEPFTVAGQKIEAAVVEDRAFEDGELHEVALDFYAQGDDGTVYYLGEDVDYYEKGKVVGHEGAFRYGEDTDNLGVAMPADPTPGSEFSIEDVPGVGSERNRVATIEGQATIGGTSYSDVLTVEGRVLPDREDEVKYYARDIGVVRETGPGSEVTLVDSSGA